MRLIDGDILLKQFRTLRDNWDTKNATHRAIRGAFVDCILRTQDAPTVDAEPVRHARWYAPASYDPCDWCSNCHERTRWFIDEGYCPKCGAKMDGGGNDYKEA